LATSVTLDLEQLNSTKKKKSIEGVHVSEDLKHLEKSKVRKTEEAVSRIGKIESGRMYEYPGTLAKKKEHLLART